MDMFDVYVKDVKRVSAERVELVEPCEIVKEWKSSI